MCIRNVNSACTNGLNNPCTLPDMTRVIDRALARAKELGMNQTKFARALGVEPANVTNWKAREDMPAAHHAKAADVLLMSVDELVGRVQIKRSKIVPLQDNPDFPSIKRVLFKLSAGASGFAVEYLQDDDAPIVFRREWFTSRGFQPSKLFAARVANGSMQPGLHPGDTVVVNTADTTPKDSEVFAINYEGELVIKRLVRDEGRWWLVSDNPDQRRYPRKVVGDGVFLLGRIVHKQSEHV